MRAILVLTALALAPLAVAHQHVRVPISIPMRDTPTTLAADAYLPEQTGSWPVILIQTPYNKESFSLVFRFELSEDPLLESPAYAFVVVDWRGFYASSGAAHADSPTGGEDGYDAVEWIAQQPWCDGNVGTWGASALGGVQMKTAAERPPHLVACVPIVYHYQERYDLYYPGGVYARNRNQFIQGHFGGPDLVRAHPLRDALWASVESTTGDAALIDVPMLHISGWYDHETSQTISEMQAVQGQGGPNAAGRQKLLIGPWSHGAIGKRDQGELQYPDAEYASSQAALEFFDHYLRGVPSGFVDGPPVRYYRINTGEWLDALSWPVPGARLETLYLCVDGALRAASPTDADAYREYVANPDAPVPTLFGAVIIEDPATQGPGDLRPIEARPDVLTFTTEALSSPLDIEGAPTAHLWVECDAVDTDLAVRLTQVYPDGRSMLLVDGIRRVSLRNGYAQRQFLSPGTKYAVEVSLPPLAATIPAGHRLRVLVCPSNYDRFDKNMHDGSSFSDAPGATATTATVRIHASAGYASSLTLPVIHSDDHVPVPTSDIVAIGLSIAFLAGTGALLLRRSAGLG